VSPDDVAAQFREAIRLRPDYAAAHNNLGLVLLQSGDDAAGIAELREAVRLRPDYADAHDNLGAALTPTDVNEAIRELELALKLAPNSVKAMYNLAIAYGASPDRGPGAEIEQLRKVISIEPSFARAHLALGKALLQDGKVPEAIDALQHAAELDPENGEAHYQLGLALARAGHKDEASAELQKGRELVAASDRAQNASLDLTEGRVALQKGDVDQAVSKFRRALQAQPDSAEAKQLLDEALAKQRKPEIGSTADDTSRMQDLEDYIRQERYQEVEPLLTEYVAAHPASSWGWYALGYSQFAQKKIGESIKSLAKSLQLDVKNAEAHKILGRSLMVIGRFDAAQVEFEQGIRYKPDSAEIHYNLGKLFSIQDNWAPARKQFDAALAIDPSYLEALDALGLTQEALGDDAGAVASYQKAIALNQQRNGHFASAHVNLSAYYNRTGDAAKALEYATKAVELDPQSDRAYFQQGRADERQGQLDAAVSALNQAIVLNPRASSYYYVLAGVYRRLGMMDESKKALDMFTRLDKETTAMDQMRRRGAEAAAPAATPR
jgi:tetratricopeptide (TPR) repeat protein